MANDSFKVKKSLNIEPIAGAAPTAKGDIVYDSTSDTLEYYNGAARTIANLDEAQTLSNKTLSSPTFSGTITSGLTGSRAVATGASGELAASSTTSTELGYVAGVTSAIQTQLDAKIAKSTLTAKGNILTATASSTPSVLAVGTDGYFLKADSAQSTGLAWVASTSSNLGVTSTQTSTYSIQTTDDVVILSNTAGGFTATLPTAVGVTGKVYTIKNVGTHWTNVLTIATTSSQTILETAAAAATTTTLNTPGETLRVISNGSNWYVLDRKTETSTLSATITFSAATSAPTKGSSPTTDVIYYSRSGRYLFIEATFANANAGSAGTGTYLLTLPQSLSLDTGAIFTSTTVGGVCGIGGISNAAAGLADITQQGQAFAYDSTRLGLKMISQAAGTNTNSLWSDANGANFTSANYKFWMSAKVPISGWKA